MRSSIYAQSWLSVPPAPACTPTTAGPASYSPVKSASSWSFRTSRSRLLLAASRAQRQSATPEASARELRSPLRALGGHLKHRVELPRLGAQGVVGVELGLRPVELGGRAGR